MSDNDQVRSRKSRLSSPLLWAGFAVILLGVAFNLGLFFVPLNVVLDNTRLVPMPEVLVGWWVVAVGILMVVWSQRGGARR